MTIITKSSPHYTILATDHTNELAEELGYNIADEEFVASSQVNGDEIRGYVMMSIFGMVRHMVGPLTLYKSDLQEWTR